jgi:hypothetical protein
MRGKVVLKARSLKGENRKKERDKRRTYHVLKFSFGGVQVQRTHNSTELLGGNGTISIFIKKADDNNMVKDGTR